MKTALITGITGQDGAYLADYLINKGYFVHGIKRRSSSFNTGRVEHLYKDPHEKELNFLMHYGDLTDATNLIRIIQETEPDEIYNLAAQSHVQVSFETPEYTANVNALGTLRLLEAIRILGMTDKVRFYQASTSEMFGLSQEAPQTEATPFYPRSPYAVAKVYAYWITVNYREAYGIYACNGILFNHESPIRGETFVTRKVTRAVSRIAIGLQKKLYIGNIDSYRDWGHAKDYVKAQWLMMQQNRPDDFVISTGEQHSVRELCELSFKEIGIDIEWRGEGVDEKGVAVSIVDRMKHVVPGDIVIEVDSNYFRPTEVANLIGNPEKARSALGWQHKIPFHELVAEMVHEDLKIAKRDKIWQANGYPSEK